MKYIAKAPLCLLLLWLPLLGQSAQTLIIPHINDGGGWQSVIVITNTSANPASATLICHSNPDITTGAVSWDVVNQEFVVSGSHVYTKASASGYTVSVHIVDTDGGQTADASGTATVDGASLTVTGTNPNSINEGSSTGTVERRASALSAGPSPPFDRIAG